MVIAPLGVRYSSEADVLYVQYAEGVFSHTEAVDTEGEILADIASDGSVLGIECLTIEPDLRALLDAFAVKHDLLLPPEIDTFQRSFS
jgi:uncharacterized protein YuzE